MKTLGNMVNQTFPILKPVNNSKKCKIKEGRKIIRIFVNFGSKTRFSKDIFLCPSSILQIADYKLAFIKVSYGMLSLHVMMLEFFEFHLPHHEILQDLLQYSLKYGKY